MKLGDLLQDLPPARTAGRGSPPLDAEIAAVRDDSRAVEPGDLFVAVVGRRADGHAFAEQAVARGAVALVVEREVAASAPQIVVPDAAEALGILAARVAGRPSDRMAVVGITGTNGKTTTTYLVEAILSAAGRAPGVIGTVNY